MNKQEYNKILDSKFEEILKPKGFKKNGIHYFLYESPIIMQIQNGWKFSDELLISFTLDYLSNTKDEKGKLKLSKFPSDFPISVPPHILKQQYKSHKAVRNFKFDLNFYSRRMGTTRNLIQLDWGLFTNEFPKSKYRTEKYINESIEILLNEGMRLKSEFNSEIAFWAMSKYRDKEYSLPPIIKMRKEVKEQILKSGNTLPERQISFLENMRLNYHYRKRDKFEK